MREGFVSFVVLAVIVGACASGPTSSKSSTPPSDPLASLRARSTLIFSIRMVAPPAQREPGDAAHEQKRAFEAALANVLTQRILGPAAKAEFRNTGRDRTGPLTNRDADLALTVTTPGLAGVSFSQAYAAAGVVLVTGPGAVSRVEDLAGKAVATTPGDLDPAEAAQAFFAQRGVQPRFQSFTGLRLAVEALDAGQVDAVAGDRAGVAVLNRQRSSALRTLSEVVSRPFVVAARSDAIALLAKVNEALAALSASSEIRKLADATSFPYEAP